MNLNLAVDINLQLTKCEEIANKYIYSHDGFIFVPGIRYPVNGLSPDKRDKLLKLSNGVVSKIPYMPYKCMPCVKALLLWWLHGDTMKEIELFKTNPLCIKGKENYYNKHMLNMTTEEIIRHYIEDITDKDLLIIDNEVMNIYESTCIKRMFMRYTDHVYEIDDNDRVLIVKTIGHIKEIRFEEAIEQQEIRKGLEFI